ncbi:MAG: / ComM-related protein, partial [Myxococcaceae bacterium]|nr:/ ComM-related protein [Myxococcaceae bacterium]
QPLEDGFVTISRAQITATFPARPMVVGATNPCPCGFRGDGARRCECAPNQVRAYRARLSGPLVDRLDIHVVLPPVDVLSLRGRAGGERSAVVRARVEKARAIQRERFTSGETSAGANAHLSAKDAESVCALDDARALLIGVAVKRMGLSARGYGKVLRVARTMADLEGATAICPAHIAEALGMRVLDRGDLSPAATAA